MASTVEKLPKDKSVKKEYKLTGANAINRIIEEHVYSNGTRPKNGKKGQLGTFQVNRHARATIESIALFLSKKVIRQAVEFLNTQKHKTIMGRDIESAIKLICPPELAKYSIDLIAKVFHRLKMDRETYHGKKRAGSKGNKAAKTAKAAKAPKVPKTAKVAKKPTQ